MIGSLVEKLRVAFDFDTIALLDALWLAPLIPAPDIEGLMLPITTEFESSGAGDQAEEVSDTKPDFGNRKQDAGNRPNAQEESFVPPPGAIYPTPDLPSYGGAVIPARPVRIPAGIALPRGLELVRAIRGLPTRIASRTEVELDEDATVDATAESRGQLVTILRPRLERWFDAALVVEHTPSMEIWSQTVMEIERILQYSGVFRDVRTYWLHSGVGPSLIRQSGTMTALASLSDPNARRLIFFFSTGVSTAWADGTIGKILEPWAQTTPVVLIHALPPHLWKGTMLGQPQAVVANPSPGGPNAELRSSRPWWARRYKLGGRRLALPVIALEKQSVLNWVEMFIARRGRKSPAFLVRTESTVAHSINSFLPELTAEERVSLFKSDSSAESFRLAVHLAAGPITLPIIHLFQTSLLGATAQHSQIAEVMLSGLVERLTPLKSNVPADRVQFRFEAGARAVLLKSLRRDDARRLAVLLQEYIEREFGSSHDFVTLVPDPAGRRSIPAGAEPFAQLRAGFMEFLGISALPSSFQLVRESATRDLGQSETQNVDPPNQGSDSMIGPGTRGLGTVVSAAEMVGTARGEFEGGVKSALKDFGVDISLADRLSQAGPEQLAREIAKRSTNKTVLYKNLTRFLNSVTNCGYVQLFSVSHKNATLVEQNGDPTRTTYRAASPRGIIGQAVESGQTVYVQDVRQSSRYIASEKSTLSELAVPVLGRNGIVVAVVNLESQVVNMFSSTQVLWIEEFVRSIGLERHQSARAFMIYSNEDRKIAERIVRSLVEANIATWFDAESIRPGELGVARSSSAFEESDCFTITLSPGALRSPTFHASLSAALQKWRSNPDETLVIPIVIRKCEAPQSLRNFEVLDLSKDFNIGCRLLRERILGWFSHRSSAQDTASRADSGPEEDDGTAEGRANRAFALESFKEAIELYSKAISADPQKAILYQQRAVAHWYAHLYPEAVRDYTTALRLDNRLELEVRAARGQVLTEMGRFDEALEDLNRAISLAEVQPKFGWSAFARRARAVAYAGVGRVKDALQEFEISRRLAPENAWLDYSLGQVLEATGKTDEAIESYLLSFAKTEPKLPPLKMTDAQLRVRRLLDLNRVGSKKTDPTGTDPLIEVGKQALARDSMQVAVGAFTAAILTDPDDVNLFLLRARAYRRAGSIQSARDDLHKIMELHPDPPSEVLIERGDLYLQAGDLANARRDFARALDLAENQHSTHDVAVVHSKLALLHERNREHESALEEISFSLSLEPGNGAFYQVRGQIAESGGDVEAARTDYETALSASGDALSGPERDQTRERLSKLSRQDAR